MNTNPFCLFRRSLSLACTFLVLLLLGSHARAIDELATEQIWGLKFGVTKAQLYVGGIPASGPNSTWRNADDDGDGLKNGAELGAGTNPFSVLKAIKISQITKIGASVAVQFPTEVGKLYQVQSTATLNNPNSWATLPSTPVPLVGDGTTKTLTVDYAANTFYRVRVIDTDTDGDQVADWAEIAVGLNKDLAETISGQTTLDYVNTQVALPNVVTIAAPAPAASEDGPTAGKFTVTRSQNLFPLTVNLDTTSSTAVAGVDYTALPASVTFPARGVDNISTLQELFVNPIPQLPTNVVQGSRSVTAVTAPAASDFPFNSTSATVIINDSTVAAGSGLLARYYDTASNVYADAANFGQLGTYVFTRGTPTTTGSIVVTPSSPAHFAGLLTGHLVKLTFTSGNAAIDNATFDHQNYTVTAVGATTFTVSIISGTAFSISTTNGNCSFSIQSIPQPATITRVDSTVNNDWQHGTPNGVVISPNNSPENYSATWDAYLQPTTTGEYTFQLDADDKARVLLDTGSGLVEILEHGWDGATTPETIGTFKQSAPITLTATTDPAQRYHIRVEHVETTGDARCRLQWKVPGTTTFANIPQANTFLHAQQVSSYTVASGVLTVNTLSPHAVTEGGPVDLWFSSGLLFSTGSYNTSYTVLAVVDGDTFTVSLPGAPVTSGAGFLGNPAVATTGWLNQSYANTTFATPPGRVGVDNGGATTQNNGIWNTGTPDLALIQLDTFSIRWTGQVQPQFSEDYTFVVQADDGCALWINGQPQVLKMYPSANTGVGSYTYDATTGDLVGNYQTAIVPSGTFLVGEAARLDFGTGNLNHTPTVSPTYSYDGTTGDAVIDYTNLIVGSPGGTVTPGSFAVGNVVELDPTSGNLNPLGNTPYTITAISGNTFTVNFGTGVYATGTGNLNINDNRNAVIATVHATGTGSYSYNSGTGVATITYSSLGLPAGTFVDGQKLVLDPTSGNLSAVPSAFYIISGVTPTTFTANFGTSFTTGIGNMFIVAPSNVAIPAGSTTAFTVNIGAGKYADNSTGSLNVDLANKSLKDWSANGNERYVRIPMIGGVRYDLQLDFYENTVGARCILSWFSASQPKQVIPSLRLYPTSLPQAPPAHVSPTVATALVGGPFSYLVAGSNGSMVTVSGNPAWLTYSGGILSGTPPPGAGGDYQIVITITNTAGTSTSVLNLHVEENSGTVVREYRSGAGTTVASIPSMDDPLNPPNTGNLTWLQAPTDFGDNYGARIRGYLTAPVSGNYYFWIAASNAAELWISNDDEPINAFKRAWLTAGSATPLNWSVNPVTQPAQKSPWLALEEGKKYYFEILHKAGIGSGDNLAVGWAMPGEATGAPSQVVPGYVLSTYTPPAPGSTPGTLYVATMLAQGGAVTNGVGNSTFRLSEDENVAYVKLDIPGFLTAPYNGLTGPMTDWHVHNDPYLTHGSAIMYDPNMPPADSGLQPDGSHKWTIPETVGTLSKAEVIELIKQGKAYINIHTNAYLNGEIRGNYTLANGSRTFTPPPAPPSWADDHATNEGAARFLAQATFGGNTADIAALKAMASYEAWIDAQFAITPVSQQLPEILAREIADAFGPFDVRVCFNTWWKTSMNAQDQLRQRIAFALSQIHVVSGQGPLEDNSRAIADFYDTLAANAFGNFRDILVGTTLTPGMGRYLDMLGNDKPDLAIGRSPNENYAREIKQLFSIGLYRMWPDGTLMLTSEDAPIDTYTQREIVGLSHVFTGWYYGYDGGYRTAFNAPADWTRPMREVPVRHFTGTKRILNNEVLPGLTSASGQPLDSYAAHLSTQYNDPVYQALPLQELNAAHDQLFNHPNTGPFICRQLIQRLVTSHPSRDYLYRVVQKFNDNGSGVRGDMKAVIKAILLDYEARSGDLLAIPSFGKQREPIQRVANAARAFRPANVSGTYAQTGGNTIAITTSTPHLLATGNSVFLEFTDGTLAGAQPAPTTGTYAVTVTDATHYTINAPGWITGTYSQTGTTITVTLNGHWLPGTNASQPGLPAENFGQAWFDFTSGPANNVAGFDQTVRTTTSSTSFDTPSGVGNVSGSTFTITAPYSATTTNQTVMISRFSGSYQCSVKGGNITIDTAYGGVGTYGAMADHGLAVADQVFINFANSRDTTSFNETSTQNDLVYSVTGVPDPNTFTVTARDAANAVMNSDNQAFIFPHKAQPLVRNGTITTRPSTYTMDNTDADLQQTPLNSPTVFNYFLPDYKFAGTLASQGMTTPEFELTSETTVIRQTNFLTSGIFNPTNNTAGISSFKTGTNALVVDLSPWMGNATGASGPGLVLGAGPQTGQVWTSNANLGTLIDRMNTLLMGGTLPSGAKSAIQKFLYRTITSMPIASPAVVTSTGHGLVNGDVITITGVTGGTFNTPINATFTVANATTDTFTLLTSPGGVAVNRTTPANSLSLTNAVLSPVAYDNVAPSATHIRDRLRAIVHFILTSPDFTIQK